MSKLNTHLTQNGVLVGSYSPVNLVTPQFIGQHFIEESGKVYVAYGLNESQWSLLQSGSTATLSVSKYEDMLNIPTASLSIGCKCYVEELNTYYKFVNGQWELDRSYVLQEEAPTDTSVIWFSPSGTAISPSQSTVTVEELVANISVLVTKMKALDKKVIDLDERLTFVEENVDLPTDDEDEETEGDEQDILLLETGDKLTLEDGNAIKLET